jgi:Carboxypeptidase regulatory-like domain
MRTGLAQGKYQLTASKRGYLTQAYEEHDGFSSAIAVGPELKSEGLIFNVIPQAVISGVVADERGEPVRGAEVRLFKDQDQWGLRSTDERQRVMTDDRCIYELSHIDPGNYYVSVSAQPWYAQRAQPMQPNNQQEDDSNAALDVVYPTTFYPQMTDSDAATPIPVKGGERIQADITLTAQQAVRVRIRLTVQDPEHAGAYSVVMSQLLFGRMETVGAPTQTVRDGVMEITLKHR